MGGVTHIYGLRPWGGCIEIVLYWNSLRPILGLSGFPQSYFKRLEFRTLVLIQVVVVAVAVVAVVISIAVAVVVATSATSAAASTAISTLVVGGRLVPTVGVKGSGRPERLQIVGLRRHHERCLPVVYCCCCWCCCRGTPRSRGGRCCFWSMPVVGVAPGSSTRAEPCNSKVRHVNVRGDTEVRDL